MYKLIRFYNQNRKKIWIFILIIVFFLLILKLLDEFSKKQSLEENRYQNTIGNNISESNSSVTSDMSLITGDKRDSNKLNVETQLIDKFIDYCNNQNIEEAYKLVSNECKELMFPTIKEFKNIYYDVVFNGNKKTYTISNWTNNIYKVQINDEILLTGDYKENSILDYITVVEDSDDTYKLNINSFIERKEINKEGISNKINVKVIKADIYMDYCVYTFEIKNDSYRTILLDDLSNIDTLYLKDTKNVRYSAYTHELTQESLKLGVSQTKKVDIKYYSKYNSSKRISNICFSSVIYDYEKYENLRYKDQYNNFCEINIKM